MTVKVFAGGFEGTSGVPWRVPKCGRKANGWSPRKRLRLPIHSTWWTACQKNGFGLFKQSGSRS